MDAQLDNSMDSDAHPIPARLQALMAQLRKAILQAPPPGQTAPDP
ncbi:hypothetical protein [Paracoccus shandongensis]|nr:hypothetical protein [Paracoccus shandongensis]